MKNSSLLGDKHFNHVMPRDHQCIPKNNERHTCSTHDHASLPSWYDFQEDVDECTEEEKLNEASLVEPPQYPDPKQRRNGLQVELSEGEEEDEKAKE